MNSKSTTPQPAQPDAADLAMRIATALCGPQSDGHKIYLRGPNGLSGNGPVGWYGTDEVAAIIRKEMDATPAPDARQPEERCPTCESRLRDVPLCSFCHTGHQWTHIRGEYSWQYPMESDRLMSVLCVNPGYVEWMEDCKNGGEVSFAAAFSAGIAWQAKVERASRPPSVPSFDVTG